MMPSLVQKHDRLLGLLREYGSCAVAFSGGVDSAVVAKAAQLALADRAVAVTAVSDSLAEGELDEAQKLAALIGIRHETVNTEEFRDANYTSNPTNRCYFCKTELYTRLERLLPRLGVAVVVNGANLDDAGDWRPGMAAAGEHQVRSPLLECGFTKDDVRALAAQWQLPVWDKPAAPCLSSRVAYGEKVTPQRLRMIDLAEQLLRSLGLRTVRVRYHRGDLARLEVPVDAIAQLASPETRERLAKELKQLGFKYVTLDLEGFRSGSQNEALDLNKQIVELSWR
jgi:uncharacterized protein